MARLVPGLLFLGGAAAALFGAPIQSRVPTLQDPARQDAAPAAAPDKALDSVWEPEWILQVDEHRIGRAKFSLVERTVTIRWVYTDQSYGTCKNRARAEQVETTSCWPTSIMALSSSLLLVAGREADGNTVIDCWTVEPPQVSGDAGGSFVQLAPQPIAAKQRVFTADQDGMRDVAWMLPRIDTAGSSSGSVFVQFWDSKNVCSIDLATGAVQLQASPRAGEAPLTLPELDQAFDQFSYGWHGTQGFVLMFGVEAAEDPNIVLMDHPADGTLDRAEVLTDALADTTGILDAKQYLPY